MDRLGFVCFAVTVWSPAIKYELYLNRRPLTTPMEAVLIRCPRCPTASAASQGKKWDSVCSEACMDSVFAGATRLCWDIAQINELCWCPKWEFDHFLIVHHLFQSPLPLRESARWRETRAQSGFLFALTVTEHNNKRDKEWNKVSERILFWRLCRAEPFLVTFLFVCVCQVFRAAAGAK